MKENLYLYYVAMRRFNQEFYKDLLTDEHLEPGKRHFKSLTIRSTGDTDKVDYWPYELVKRQIRYLWEPVEDNHPLNILPIMVHNAEEVATGGQAYMRISEYTEARFRPEKKMSFREVVDKLCGHEHTNPNHQRLLVLLGLNQYINRSYFRVCSPPGVGKDSSAETISNLVNRCYILNNPSAAKLSLRANSKWLTISEVADIEKKDLRVITQFLLEAGAGKPKIEKPTREFGGVGETIDVSKLSISIAYNDIQSYSDGSRHFDVIMPDAVKDRFCPLRVYGHFTEEWNQIYKIDWKRAVDNNHEVYKDLIYTIKFYEENFESELSRYDHTLLHRLAPKLSSRHVDSLTQLLNIIDIYCESQDEFNAWCLIIAESIQDYYDMLDYDIYLDNARRKLHKQWEEVEQELEAIPTYTKKKQYLKAKMEKDKTPRGDILL